MIIHRKSWLIPVVICHKDIDGKMEQSDLGLQFLPTYICPNTLMVIMVYTEIVSFLLSFAAKNADTIEILKQASFMIQSRFNISETTIQVEEYVDDMLDCTHCQDLPD